MPTLIRQPPTPSAALLPQPVCVDTFAPTSFAAPKVIDALSSELNLAVLAHVSPIDLVNVSAVNRASARLVNHDTVLWAKHGLELPATAPAEGGRAPTTPQAAWVAQLTSLPRSAKTHLVETNARANIFDPGLVPDLKRCFKLLRRAKTLRLRGALAATYLNVARVNRIAQRCGFPAPALPPDFLRDAYEVGMNVALDAAQGYFTPRTADAMEAHIERAETLAWLAGIPCPALPQWHLDRVRRQGLQAAYERALVWGRQGVPGEMILCFREAVGWAERAGVSMPPLLPATLQRCFAVRVTRDIATLSKDSPRRCRFGPAARYLMARGIVSRAWMPAVELQEAMRIAMDDMIDQAEQCARNDNVDGMFNALDLAALCASGGGHRLPALPTELYETVCAQRLHSLGQIVAESQANRTHDLPSESDYRRHLESLDRFKKRAAEYADGGSPSWLSAPSLVLARPAQ